MNEKEFWAKLRPLLIKAAARLTLPCHFERVENGAGVGTPDVSYCVAGREGHIELKYIPAYPKRPLTPVLGKRGLRKEQIVWATKRLRAGGCPFALIGVNGDIYLMRLDSIERITGLNDMTAEQLYKESSAVLLLWGHMQKFDNLLHCLRS